MAELTGKKIDALIQQLRTEWEDIEDIPVEESAHRLIGARLLADLILDVPWEEETDWPAFAKDLLSKDPEALRRHLPDFLRPPLCKECGKSATSEGGFWVCNTHGCISCGFQVTGCD